MTEEKKATKSIDKKLSDPNKKLKKKTKRYLIKLLMKKLLIKGY